MCVYLYFSHSAVNVNCIGIMTNIHEVLFEDYFYVIVVFSCDVNRTALCGAAACPLELHVISVFPVICRVISTLRCMMKIYVTGEWHASDISHNDMLITRTGNE